MNCGCAERTCEHPAFECSGRPVTVERPHGIDVPLCEVCVIVWAMVMVAPSKLDVLRGKA